MNEPISTHTAIHFLSPQIVEVLALFLYALVILSIAGVSCSLGVWLVFRYFLRENLILVQGLKKSIAYCQNFHLFIYLAFTLADFPSIHMPPPNSRMKTALRD